MGIAAYLGADHHMFDRRDKPDTTCQQVNIETMQPKLRPELEQGCGKQMPSARKLFFRDVFNIKM